MHDEVIDMLVRAACAARELTSRAASRRISGGQIFVGGAEAFNLPT